MARIMCAIVQPDILGKADRAKQHEAEKERDTTRDEAL